MCLWESRLLSVHGSAWKDSVRDGAGEMWTGYFLGSLPPNSRTVHIHTGNQAKVDKQGDPD